MYEQCDLGGGKLGVCEIDPAARCETKPCLACRSQHQLRPGPSPGAQEFYLALAVHTLVDGSVTTGPATKDLEHFLVSVDTDGKITVDTREEVGTTARA